LYPISDVLLTHGDAASQASESNQRSGRLPDGALSFRRAVPARAATAAVLSTAIKAQADI
jgi:hypothetical protein